MSPEKLKWLAEHPEQSDLTDFEDDNRYVSDGGELHVVLVQCTSAKRKGFHAAKDLYDESAYFVRQREYAESVADFWFVQSAEHGLLHPDEMVGYYDKHAKDIEYPEEWALDIADELFDLLGADITVELLGGKAYTDPLVPELEARGMEVHEPLRGLRIGKRIQRLRSMANASLEEF